MNSSRKFPLYKSTTTSVNLSNLLNPKRASSRKQFVSKKQAKTPTKSKKPPKFFLPKPKASREDDKLDKYFLSKRGTIPKPKPNIEVVNKTSETNRDNDANILKTFMSSKKTIPFELTDDERSVSIDRERLKKAEKERPKNSDSKANKIDFDDYDRLDFIVDSIIESYDTKPLDWKATQIGNDLIDVCNSKFEEEINRSVEKKDVEIQTSVCSKMSKLKPPIEKQKPQQKEEIIGIEAIPKENAFLENSESVFLMPRVDTNNQQHSKDILFLGRFNITPKSNKDSRFQIPHYSKEDNCENTFFKLEDLY